MPQKRSTTQGFSLMELILAVALFMIFSRGLAGTAIGGYLTSFENARMVKVNALLVESWEALHSIRDGNWNDIANGIYGLTMSGGHWALLGSSDEVDGYTRIITIADVLRDDLGNIVASGTNVDPDTKRISIELSWNDSAGQERSLYVESYLTNYVSPAVWPEPPPAPAPEP